MMYTFAQVREFVRANLSKYNWYRPDLILSDSGSQDEGVPMEFGSSKLTTYQRYLKYPITADAVFKFLSNETNKSILRESLEPTDFVGDKDSFTIPLILDRLCNIDGDILEFDDQYSRKELVYSLVVNRLNKRITVCFRGSVTGGMDWRTNFRLSLKSIPVPQELIDLGVATKIQVHTGFDGK